MKKAKLILVTGFLGSGKTSFLKFFLNRFSNNYRIAVIQNEFSGTNIDAIELKNSSWKFELVEINNGSIFCVCQFSNFKEQLEKLYYDYCPDLVVIEATGLADPLSVGMIFNNSELYYLSKIITIIDSINYKIVSKLVMAVNNQVKIADIVLINKTDLVGDSNNNDDIIEDIKMLNPNALIYNTSYSEFNEIDIQDSTMPIVRVSGELSEMNESISSEIIRDNKQMTQAELDEFIAQIPENTIRLKGYVKIENNKSCLIQYVMGLLDVKYFDNPINRTELIKIFYK